VTASTLAILAFAIAAITVSLWAVLLRSVNIPKNRSAFVISFAIAASLGITALVMGTGHWAASTGAGIAIFIGLFFLFTVAIGDQKGGTGKFKLGQPLPALSAPDENKQLFDIATLAGQPILLKFFRGHW
jgi:hypothetical protein